MTAFSEDRWLRGELTADDLDAYFTLSDRNRELLEHCPAGKLDATGRLGLAVQLCALRWLGYVPDDLTTLQEPAWMTLSRQLKLTAADRELLHRYGEPARGSHFHLVRQHLGFRPWDDQIADQMRAWLSVRPLELDGLLDYLRTRKIVAPPFQTLRDLIDDQQAAAAAAAAAAAGAPAGAGRSSPDEPFGIGAVQPLKLEADALAVLIDGEQRLLALFDARQDRADTRLAATATGALAVPAATLALASSMIPTALAIGVYGLDIVVILIVLYLRSTSGAEWRPRLTGGTRAASSRRRLKFWKQFELSAESFESDQARTAWWAQPPTADLFIAQSRSLELWRTRAQRSRDLAHRKEAAAAEASAAFAGLLLLIGALAAGKAAGLY